MAIAPLVSEDMRNLDRFDAELEKLKVQFEQYFIGIERLPPTDTWERMKRELRQKIVGVKSTNTAYKFKRQTVEQKFVTLSNYWTRVLNEIEEGTYQRLAKRMEIHDRQRAEQAEARERNRIIREAARSGSSVAEALRQWEASKASGAAGPSVAGAAPVAPAAAAPRGPASAPPPASGGSALDRLHEAYLSARTRTGEGNVSRDQFAAMIQKQIPVIKQKFNCRTVEFKVVVEDGKTKLKAIPKN